MSPLPYQADSTEKIAFVHPSTTTVPVSSMLKKAGVALTIGSVVFVAGNAWKEGPTSDSTAAVSVSHLTFGEPVFSPCDDLSGKSKEQCTCIFDKCGDIILDGQYNPTFRNCIVGGNGCTEYECFFGCAMGYDSARGCLLHYNCLS